MRLNNLYSLHPFTKDEAWSVFRLAAFAEALGWSLLLAAITIKHYHWYGQSVAIPIAGQIHGMFFLAYFTALVFVFTSLEIRRAYFLLGLMAGIAPFGSLLFEVYLSKRVVRSYGDIVRVMVMSGENCLAVMPSKGTKWELPFTFKAANENDKSAVMKLLNESFGLNINYSSLKKGSTGFLQANCVEPISREILNKAATGNPFVEEYAYIPLAEVSTPN